jgi:dipeptidyl aminopeptidase/acylaminoacyl peptidase
MALCLSMGAPATADPAPTMPPVESYAELPFIGTPSLSPDGTRIAARVFIDGKERIGIWLLNEPRDHPPRIINVDGLERFEWAGDNRLLINRISVRLIATNTMFALGPSRTIVSYDLGSDKTAVLGPSAGLFSEVIFVDPIGRYALLSSQAAIDRPPSVFRVDLATGAAVEVQRSMPNVWSWFADAAGVVRVGVDYEEDRARIYYRARPDAPLVRAEARRDFLDDSAIDMVRFVTNTDHGVMVTNSETGRFALYDYDFASDTRGAVIFDRPDVDVGAATFGPDGAIDGIAYEDERPHMHWLNPVLAQMQQRIDRALPGKTNQILNRSRDGNRALIFSAAADDPGTYYIYDQAAHRLELFASPYATLTGQHFAEVRPVSYTARDGTRIAAYLTLPPGRVPHALPLIVLPHGGPFARDSWTFDPEVQFLASRGYAVLQPNFRGSTGYGRDFVARGYGQYGGGMIDDIDDGVDWAATQGIADPRRICIMGSSYGGYAAIWAAMRAPQRYRCAISFAGPSDLGAMIRYDANLFIPRRYVRELRRRLRGDANLNLNAISPLRHPEMLRVPALLAHGRLDAIVPPDQTQRLSDALARHSQAHVETYFYPKAQHGFTDAGEATDYYRHVEAFLARYNPADGVAPPSPAAASTAGESSARN